MHDVALLLIFNIVTLPVLFCLHYHDNVNKTKKKLVMLIKIISTILVVW